MYLVKKITITRYKYDTHSKIVDLPKVSEDTVKDQNTYQCIKNRRNMRLYSEEELSYLLWATLSSSILLSNIELLI